MGKTSKHENSTLSGSKVQFKQTNKRKSTVAKTASTTEVTLLKETKVKDRKSNTVGNKSVTTNKKILFNDDMPVEVKPEKPLPSNSEIINNKTQLVPDDEAEVKDEDIDAFCDEIDEEDNVQFDDWVKLIEQKLGSNKKKQK